MPTKADLEAEVERLRENARRLEEKIRAEVQRVAEEQDWCKSGQNEVLENLGLEPITQAYSALLTIKVRVKGSTSVDPSDVNEAFIRSSLQESWNVEHLSFDEDWVDDDSQEFQVEDVEVTEVRKETA